MENTIFNGNSPQAVIPETGYVDVFQQVENALISDVQKVKFLAQNGLLSNVQEQYLLNTLEQKANYLNLCKQAMLNNVAGNQSAPSAVPPQTTEINSLELFSQENPGFFDSGARPDVLEYIKELGMDKDEISKIAEMVKKLENSAVESYLKKSAHEKSLNDENLAAKSKLTSYAQNAVPGDNKRIYTRADLGDMSAEEFTKNEKLIMDQVKQGLLK